MRYANHMNALVATGVIAAVLLVTVVGDMIRPAPPPSAKAEPFAKVEPAAAATLALAEATSSYIVRSRSVDLAEALVRQVGGEVTARIEIIDAVGANLDRDQVRALERHADTLGVYSDGKLEVMSGQIDTHYPAQAGARTAHDLGYTGEGVTIAVLDTGLWQSGETAYTTDGDNRIRATHDATRRDWFRLWNYGGGDDCSDDDEVDCEAEILDDFNGHGTHVTSIMAGSGQIANGAYNGIAPNAEIVAVRAFEPDGSGTYLNVLLALDWIVRHQDDYDIDVLNLSFGAPADSHYWQDPVNLAVMEAWAAGITVVASAGNSGPGPMTIGVPGNVPYIITVGAYTDSYTPADEADDRLTSFSAAGPTIEGFVKPEIVAPGGHMLGIMPPYAWLALEYPEYVQPLGHGFTMSGTSQAAAVVTGVVALMLEADPSLGPDDIKCRLMATAQPAVRPDGEYAYTVFQQGAGKVDAAAAINNRQRDCANTGLDIGKDLDADEHYAGPAGVDADGTYYLVDPAGTRQTGSGFEWVQGAVWPDGAVWPEGAIWGETLWNASTSAENAGALNPDSFMTEGLVWPEQPVTSGDLVASEGLVWPEDKVKTKGLVWPENKVKTKGLVWPENKVKTKGLVWPEKDGRTVTTYLWVEQE